MSKGLSPSLVPPTLGGKNITMPVLVDRIPQLPWHQAWIPMGWSPLWVYITASSGLGSSAPQHSTELRFCSCETDVSFRASIGGGRTAFSNTTQPQAAQQNKTPLTEVGQYTKCKILYWILVLDWWNLMPHRPLIASFLALPVDRWEHQALFLP